MVLIEQVGVTIVGNHPYHTIIARKRVQIRSLNVKSSFLRASLRLALSVHISTVSLLRAMDGLRRLFEDCVMLQDHRAMACSLVSVCEQT